jgi:hypothetical protein
LQPFRLILLMRWQLHLASLSITQTKV